MLQVLKEAAETNENIARGFGGQKWWNETSHIRL